MSKKYKRILLKLSGEGLMGKKDFGWDMDTIQRTALEVKPLLESGMEVVITCGGGNVFRGLVATGIGFNRNPADHMGMLATIMNGLALKSVFESLGMECSVLSARGIDSVCDAFSYYRAESDLKAGKVVICVGGTGNPFFTTDTGSVLRAVETGCDIMLKATQVDGIYSADPKTDKNATRYDSLTYDEVLSKNLKVMDLTAITLAKNNSLPIMVFDMHKQGTLNDVVNSKGTYTVVTV